MKRFMICAGDHRQAETLAWLMKTPNSDWSYVFDSDRLLGLRGMTIIMWGTWKGRADINLIFATAQAMDMTILYMNDGRG